MDRMFRRLIGEHIELVTIPGDDLWTVHIDPGQIEQVLTNLVINARDAMVGGGKLIIRTENVSVKEASDSYPDEIGPGAYVLMEVSDTGTGMNTETLSHIFEPFFSTKTEERGTGLGLSTCYGIIKQAGGAVRASSEPGKGTTVSVFLPRAEGDELDEARQDETKQLLDGSETVLVVEDEDSLRKMVRHILIRRGYNVLESANGEEALRTIEKHQGEVQLLLTDLIMPRMGGKELSELLKTKYPKLQVLYMSGYTGDSPPLVGDFEPGRSFIQKPFRSAQLLQRIRQILD